MKDSWCGSSIRSPRPARFKASHYCCQWLQNCSLDVQTYAVARLLLFRSHAQAAKSYYSSKKPHHSKTNGDPTKPGSRKRMEARCEADYTLDPERQWSCGAFDHGPRSNTRRLLPKSIISISGVRANSACGLPSEDRLSKFKCLGDVQWCCCKAQTPKCRLALLARGVKLDH